jgi:hypothetical protein
MSLIHVISVSVRVCWIPHWRYDSDLVFSAGCTWLWRPTNRLHSLIAFLLYGSTGKRETVSGFAEKSLRWDPPCALVWPITRRPFRQTARKNAVWIYCHLWSSKFAHLPDVKSIHICQVWGSHADYNKKCYLFVVCRRFGGTYCLNFNVEE